MPNSTRLRSRFEPLEAETYKDRVVNLITEAILNGRVKAGERLNESQLARELNLSRIPIREALQTLEEMGLVVNVPRRGTFVISLSEDNIQKINSFRLVGEAEALRLCRANITSEKLHQLIRLLERMEKTSSQTETWKLELEFHRAIWRFSGNEYLEKVLTATIIPLFAHGIVTSFGSEVAGLRAKHHWSLLEYVRGRSQQSAEEVMMEHLKGGFHNPERFSSYSPTVKSTLSRQTKR